MDTTTATVIAVVIIGLIVVAAFLRFNQRGQAILKVFGIDFSITASNDPPPQTVGINAEDILSHEGGVVADDSTGRGVSAKRVDSKQDVLLSSKGTNKDNDPKANPPT